MNGFKKINTKEVMTASMVDSCLQTSAMSENDANFAVICSFFHKFSASLGVNYNIQQLKEMIEDNNNCEKLFIYFYINQYCVQINEFFVFIIK